MKQYKVFVSSTYKDNKLWRETVENAITSVGMVWVGMELFTATTDTVTEQCLKEVAGAHLFVGLISHCYGWEPPGRDISITEMEYDRATERLMFIIDPAKICQVVWSPVTQ